LLALLLCAVASALLAACAGGYTLGPSNGLPAGARSVQINLFENRTWEPRLSDPVAVSLRRAVQRDGTYRLATQGDGDVVLDGVITEFSRSGISFQPEDVRTVRDYELLAVAEFTARERATGRVVASGKTYGRTTIRSGADLASAERQAAPLIAEDLARNIASALVDGTW